MKIKHILIVFFLLSFVFPVRDLDAKHADLAGRWYSPVPERLRAELEGYLDKARPGKLNGRVIGVIAPHAGYRYSGPVAAFAFKALMENPPEKLVIVGFTHRRYFPNRISVLTDEYFVTPLGKAHIDRPLSEELISYSERIGYMPQAFISENSVEMEVPFAQVALDDPRLVLVALGDQSKANSDHLADALYEVLKDEENYAILASADMCHHKPYDVAKRIDADTIEAIETFDPDRFYAKSLRDENDQRMCGYGAVYAVMKASKRLGADKVKLLKYANSGDTSGMKDRVVGYMSAAFIKSDISDDRERSTGKDKETSMYDKSQRKELLKIARDTIRHYLETGERLEVEVVDEALQQEMGAFVTLHKNGALRGCIGHMVAKGPLYLAVRDMAIAAAVEDPRFPPLKASELDEVDIEISALSPMVKIEDHEDIEMGKHGVMVRMGWRSGVYLPQVAEETGWSREQFMNSLCAHKAGIPPNAWKTGQCDIYVFTAEVFGEKELSE
ncbi:MAG: AmmeMemoRadiSam system protein B [Candidatus Omnitrophica bacterium]|nr:AmmeMemoRadiSam system protein B [Candidatus Omnitrophota bacterium]